MTTLGVIISMLPDAMVTMLIHISFPVATLLRKRFRNTSPPKESQEAASERPCVHLGNDRRNPRLRDVLQTMFYTHGRKEPRLCGTFNQQQAR